MRMPAYENIAILGAIRRLHEQLLQMEERISSVSDALKRIEETGVSVNFQAADDSETDMDDSSSESSAETAESVQSAPF